MRRAIVAAMAAAGAALVPAAALAADLPVKAPPTAVTAESGGFYVWVDGSYQSIHLPTFNLGPATHVGRFPPFGTGVYGSQILNLDPRVAGAGISGAVGYVLPPGSFWAFGSNFRIEFGASYVHATGTTSGALSYTLPAGATTQLLNGNLVLSFGCVGICNSGSSLATTYDSWQFDLKAAGDFKSGLLTWTPSVAVFGGSSRDSQILSHLTNNGFSPTLNQVYNANTRLEWNDVGARAGLGAKVDLTSAVAFGVSGFVGVAGRHTDLTGNDQLTSGAFTNTSTLAVGANKTALVANAEARLTFRPMPRVTLMAFAGLNYDDSVPGIAAPSFVGPFTFAAPTIPAAIAYAKETSYYAGGGLKVRFAP